MKTSLKRRILMAGVVLGAMGATLLAPSVAQAALPNPLPPSNALGTLHLSPTSGTGTEMPTYSTTNPCPAGTNVANVNTIDLGNVEQTISNNVPGPTSIAGPFSVTGFVDMNTVQALAGTPGTVESFLFLVDCRTGAGHGTYTDAVQVNFAANGSWQVAGAGPVATTTTLTPASQTVSPGTNVTVTATVAPANATGTVEFKEGASTLFTTPPGSSPFTFSSTTLALGTHTITATFHSGNPAAFADSNSVSPAIVNVASDTVTASETIQVSVPLQQGVFTMTVDPGIVDMGTAVLQGTGSASHFHAAGTLKNVNISDGRDQSVPGWTVTGQVGDFTNTTDATKHFSGTSLGWTPNVVQQNPAGDVIAGAAVPTGTTPGLTSASVLGGAHVSHGLGDSKLGAALALDFPRATTPGTYAATMTITGLGGTPLP